MNLPDASPSVQPAGNQQPWTVHHVATTGSTNAELLSAALAGAPDRSVLVAEHQTAGRGRLDRIWEAPPGANLLVSVLFRTGFDPTNPHCLTRAVAIAAARTAEELTTARPVLKWPNDLLLEGEKLGGILAQASSSGGQVAVVVGMGLNLGWAPPGAARLVGVTPSDFLPVWLDNLADLLAQDTMAEYRQRLATLGQEVRVEVPTGVHEGRAADVRADGALVLETQFGQKIITIGDVVHLRAI